MSVRWSNVPIPQENVAALAMGLALQYVAPVRLPPGALWVRVLGRALVVAGALLGAWAVASMGTIDSEAPEELIVGGPYALSRNPMYLAWALIHAGLGLAAKAPWLIATLPTALAYTDRVVIPAEEAQLADAFGDAYAQYRAHVPRYW